MKVIDLLNKVANGEEMPKRFKFIGKIFTKALIGNEWLDDDEHYFIKDYIDYSVLNYEIEIIEDTPKKIPEKIKDKYSSQISKVELAQKYNEIIDYLEYLKSKGDE